MAYLDHFGYSPLKAEIVFDGGAISPALTYDEAAEWIRTHTHPDSYVYPPVVITHRGSDEQGWVEVPQSRRGAFLHGLPTSHELRLDTVSGDQERLRRADGGFLVHLFGFITGHRCQFEGWWIDGRANTHEESDHHLPRPKEAATVIGTAYQRWRSWDPRQRIVSTNALYLHTRVPTFEFTWEAFHNQYMVVDAAFALIRDTGGQVTKPRKHDDRLAWMCDTYGIVRNDALITSITKIRHDLFHEALWLDGMPGDEMDQEGWSAYCGLRSLSTRLLLAAHGIKGEYVSSAWWDLCTRSFTVEAAP